MAKRTQVLSLAVWVIAPVICLFPPIGRAVTFGSWHAFIANVTWWGLAWYAVWFFNAFQNLMILMRFSLVVSLDFKRRYSFVRFCTRLIELKKSAFTANYPDFKAHLFPRCQGDKEGRRILKDAVLETLDLGDADTMYNWSKLRAFFLDFGLRFLRREEAVLGYFVLSQLVLVAFYVSMIYVGLISVNYWEAAFTVLSSLSVLTPAFSALSYATKINAKAQEQKWILADKRLRLEKERGGVETEAVRDRTLSAGDESEAVLQRRVREAEAALGRASAMLEKIVKMLDVDRFRIRMLGYSIDTTVTGIIAAVIGTVGFLVARLRLGDEGEGLPD